MRLGFRLSISLAAGVMLVSLGFALYQTQNEQHNLNRDLERHAVDLAETLERSAGPLVWSHSWRDLQRLVDRFQNHEHLAGVAVYDIEDRPLAVTPALASRLGQPPVAAVEKSARQTAPVGEYLRLGKDPMHVFVTPVHAGEAILGVLAVFHDTGYITARTADMWRRALESMLVQTALIVSVTLLMLRWGIGRPIAHLANWLRDLRNGENTPPLPSLPEEDSFRPLQREATRLAATLNQARAAAETEARLRSTAESVWTPERLRISVQNRLGGCRLYAISNREPYVHSRRGNAIEYSVPASGLVTALEPILRACDGTWIAQGTGDADREVVDERDRLRVPPDHPQYTLRRVWVTPREEEGFYFGFANEGLWPLCHIAHTRPVFRAQDWEEYYKINRRFADAFLEEAADEINPALLVQDYHFALVPRMVKEARPDARTAIFWHIPWPNPEAFGICPWQRELLEGLLGADLIGFHLQSHCNNFLDTVDRVVEARVNRERFAVNRRGHLTSVRPFPISVSFQENAATVAPSDDLYAEQAALLGSHGVRAVTMGIGVDRVDYTKGLPERLLGLERFFEKYPLHRGRFTFVQIGAPSRTHIRRYQELFDFVRAEVDRINRRFATREWRPVVFLAEHHSHEQILPYYRTADVGLVTSLHDGMNLVAKEYVAAQASGHGVLVLSPFAGAAQELADALQVNPYDTEALADAIHYALDMGPEERRARMVRMRATIREHNIYRWAGDLIAELAAVRLDQPREIRAYQAPVETPVMLAASH
jgi:trehalose 6-phosphate synthase